MTYDVRAIANLVLRLADEDAKSVTNLGLNKIVYFLHAAHLHEHRTPLVTAKIEAWQYGPVFRELYHQFKKFGSDPVTTRATRLEPSTGELREVVDAIAPQDAAFVEKHATELLCLSPGKLVDMSHVSDGPWYAARFGNGSVNPGVEITADLIMSAGNEQARH